MLSLKLGSRRMSLSPSSTKQRCLFHYLKLIVKSIKRCCQRSARVISFACLILFVTMFTVNAVTFAIGVTKINRANKKLDELVLTVSEQSTYTLEAFPGVSIIKPLFGADANLESNLETYFNLRYPRYEILFSVQEPGDPALEISTRLSKKYPNISVSFFIGAPKLGLNLKIDNMIRSYDAAKYDLIWNTDAGIRVQPDALADMVSYLEDDVGVVYQLPFMCDRPGFFAFIEKVNFGTFLARGHLVAPTFGFPQLTGMSFLFRKSVLESIGGLRQLLNRAAEDALLGMIFAENGYKVEYASLTAQQNPEPGPLAKFYARHKRWLQIRNRVAPFYVIILEIVSTSPILCLCFAQVMSYFFGWGRVPAFFTGMMMYFVADLMYFVLFNGGWMDRPFYEYVVAWLWQEIVVLPSYAHFLWTDDGLFRWNGRVLKVTSDAWMEREVVMNR